MILLQYIVNHDLMKNTSEHEPNALCDVGSTIGEKSQSLDLEYLIMFNEEVKLLTTILRSFLIA